jgi:hypothetical protein
VFFVPHYRPVRLPLISLACASQSLAEITIEKSATGGALIRIDGSFLTGCVLDQVNKPCLWPTISAAGKTMSRACPMKAVEGEQHDHPHHCGLNQVDHENPLLRQDVIGCCGSGTSEKSLPHHPSKNSPRVCHSGPVM